MFVTQGSGLDFGSVDDGGFFRSKILGSSAEVLLLVWQGENFDL